MFTALRLRLVPSIAWALLAVCVAREAQAAGPKRILIIHSFGRDFAPYDNVASVFRTELARGSTEAIAIFESTLDAGLAAPGEAERPFAVYLNERFAGAPPDLVVTIGPPAARFFVANRDKLFPGSPVVVAAVEERLVHGLPLRAGDGAAVVKLDVPSIFNHIIQVLPDTQTIAVVFGTTQLERFWVTELKTELASLAGRIDFVWLNDLSLDQIEQRVAALPANSAVFYGLLIVDAAGVPREREDVLRRLRAVSKVPLFGWMESEIGKGTVGGPYSSQRRNGEQAAAMALRILSGAEAAGPQVEVASLETPIYDWRELQRWNILQARLPPGSEIRFRQPSLWEEHRVAVTLTVGVLALQAALIATLLRERNGRRDAERQAQSLGGRLITAQEDERRRLARELHDDITQRLAVLAIEAATIEGQPDVARNTTAQSIREGLVKLSEDVHALSYRLHPTVIEDLGLVQALKTECDRIAHNEPIHVDLDSKAVPGKLSHQTALCLFRVAQEALHNVARHAGASAVRVSLQREDGALLLAVHDNGRGFDTSRNKFRASLGIASMRERVRLLSGELEITSAPGYGTTVVARVPLRDAG